MKTESDVRQKVRQLRKRRFKQLLRERTGRAPQNCTHNEQHTDAGGCVGICTFAGDDQWWGKVCDDVETAQECPFFESVRDRKAVQEEFEGLLEDDDLRARRYPRLDALLWVLGEGVEDLGWLQRLRKRLPF